MPGSARSQDVEMEKGSLTNLKKSRRPHSEESNFGAPLVWPSPKQKHRRNAKATHQSSLLPSPLREPLVLGQVALVRVATGPILPGVQIVALHGGIVPPIRELPSVLIDVVPVAAVVLRDDAPIRPSSAPSSAALDPPPLAAAVQVSDTGPDAPVPEEAMDQRRLRPGAAGRVQVDVARAAVDGQGTHPIQLCARVVPTAGPISLEVGRQAEVIRLWILPGAAPEGSRQPDAWQRPAVAEGLQSPPAARRGRRSGCGAAAEDGGGAAGEGAAEREVSAGIGAVGVREDPVLHQPALLVVAVVVDVADAGGSCSGSCIGRAEYKSTGLAVRRREHTPAANGPDVGARLAVEGHTGLRRPGRLAARGATLGGR
mmetsp:Transcript_63843/g.183380  ORF Transcript_63843/g.183380 Transcript_63843/m.183380 type:complete len:371 (-) Transcript_63843:693-1805(-)